MFSKTIISKPIATGVAANASIKESRHSPVLYRLMVVAPLVFAMTLLLSAPTPQAAESASQLAAESKAALQKLYSESPEAKEIGGEAKAVLVIPKVIKAGLLVGGQYGEGTLLQGGEAVGYYSSGAVSYGLQAGVQWFGYAMFLMNDSAVEYLDKSDGWEIGSGPSVVVWDQGAATAMTSTTIQEDALVFVFGQEGLMAGLGLQGTKITEIHPPE